MRRLFCIAILLMLLCGCGGPGEHSDPSGESLIPTQPTASWIETAGMPWDEAGALLEMPLNIPDALHYNNARAFDGDLLLWSLDTHLENVFTLELCLVELDDGTVAMEREIDFTESVIPQILGDRIFLCNRYDGTIQELNKKLETVNSWALEPREAGFTMGAGEILYIYDWNGTVTKLDLKTGEEIPLMEEGTYIEYFSLQDDLVSIEYFPPDSGNVSTAVLDLATGQLLYAPVDGQFSTVSCRNSIWLWETYRDGYTAYTYRQSGEHLQVRMGNDTLQQLTDGNILRIWEDGCTFSLYDPNGKALSQVKLTAEPFGYTPTAVIPSERYGGYFVLITNYSYAMRLLYWDVEKCPGEEDIPFAPVPEPGEEEAAVRNRILELESLYGINILAGEETQTSFYDFTAEQVTDWTMVHNALDILEDALQDYPEDFFRQLRYDTIRSVDIHLVGNILPTTEEYVHNYAAFVQYEYDRFTMGVDIYTAGEETYYHEFSHVIDSFLEWDASVREDALFSEEGWNSLNPHWFPGYTYNYSQEIYLVDEESFVDSYSTIKPTEDRARVMEYAMADYGSWRFDNETVLSEKLDYYCRCIRDAFDTTGWPENLLWEQYQ